jgi:RHS repeat-associated protein
LLAAVDASGNKRHFYHFDESGSTNFLTDDSGAVTDSYAVTPYGETVMQTGSTANPFTFHGAFGVVQEDATGLYYMRDRYYDATSARFLSRDPNSSLDPRQLNPYQFVEGNPIEHNDPSGRKSISDLDPTEVTNDEIAIAAGRSGLATMDALFKALSKDNWSKGLDKWKGWKSADSSTPSPKPVGTDPLATPGPTPASPQPPGLPPAQPGAQPNPAGPQPNSPAQPPVDGGAGSGPQPPQPPPVQPPAVPAPPPTPAGFEQADQFIRARARENHIYATRGLIALVGPIGALLILPELFQYGAGK